jgi:magnesium-protoporphyrin IX monomethyl ester (oxidative) cyclase
MARWLPAIFHLQPPTGVARIRYDRFSPYQMRPHDFDLTLEPSRTYPYVYPLPNESLKRLAYSFEDNKRPRHMHRALSEEPGQQQLQEVVRHWNELWRTNKPMLKVYDDGDDLRVVDTRPCAIQSSWTMRGEEAEIYRLCDSAQPVAMIKSQAAIDTLLKNKVMLRINDKLLSIGTKSA